jgi:hypothetical protein
VTNGFNLNGLNTAEPAVILGNTILGLKTEYTMVITRTS